MKPNTISVVVPVYNAESTLAKCVGSILNQTYTDLEVILVDDGATDSSPVILDDFAKQDPRVRVIHKPNGGVHSARNAGTMVATGKWLTYVESDDHLPPEACATLIGEAEKGDYDMVMGAYYKEGSNKTTIKHLFEQDRIEFDEQQVRDILLKKVLGLTGKQLRKPQQIDTLLTCSAKLYKTEIIHENNIKWPDRKITYSDCLDFLLEYVYHCKRVLYIDVPLYYYVRYNTESQTASFRPRTIELWHNQFLLLRDFIDGHNLGDLLDEAYYNRVCFSVIPIGGNAYRMKNHGNAIAEIKKMFAEPIYKKAFKRFDTSEMPLYWRVFFFTAKHKMVLPFYAITIGMRKLMNRQRNL